MPRNGKKVEKKSTTYEDDDEKGKFIKKFENSFKSH